MLKLTKLTKLTKQTMAAAGLVLGLSLMAGACGGMEQDASEGSIPYVHEVVVNPDVTLAAQQSLEHNLQGQVLAPLAPVVDTSQQADPTAEVELADPVTVSTSEQADRTAELELADPVAVDPEKSLEDNRQEWIPTSPDGTDEAGEPDLQADPEEIELPKERIDPRDRPGLDD